MSDSRSESPSDDQVPDTLNSPSDERTPEAESSASPDVSPTEPERQPSVRRKLRTLTFGKRRKGLAKDPVKKKHGPWNFKFACRIRRSSNPDTEPSVGCSTCICTGYKRTEENHLGAGAAFKGAVCKQHAPSSQFKEIREEHQADTQSPIIDLTRFKPEEYPVDDCDELARQERAREIEEGVDPPPGYHLYGQPQTSPSTTASSSSSSSSSSSMSSAVANGRSDINLAELTLALRNQLSLSVAPYPYLERLAEVGLSRDFISTFCELTGSNVQLPTVHTQIDYIHCLVPDLLEITNCRFYWGKMDRYEAEKLLENKPEGTFLLRDSAQDEYLFSVSFRRYGRSLHARIEQWNHKFSFDSHDPGVFASSTVCGLIEHYKDPTCCMFFEPMLTLPLHRTFPFSLQHLCRAAICNHINYDGINHLQLPKSLKSYLKEYHYKQRVRVRRLDVDH